MASSPKKALTQGRGKKRPAKYLSHGSGKKRYLELRSGLQGVLITCEGGREHLSCREAVQVLERFYESLCEGKAGSNVHEKLNSEQHDSDSKPPTSICENASASSPESAKEDEDEGAAENTSEDDSKVSEKKSNVACLLEDEIAELRDRKQARFARVETGCAGVIFIRMLIDNAASVAMERGPSQVVQAIVQDCIRTRKPITRYCLRFLPIEVTCYASADEVRKMAGRFLSQHFPIVEKDKALKFAVVYEARANTSLDRMEIINTVAKLVAQPHSVDLKNPDKTILVQVVKTVCAIGVVSNYRQYAKYNIRELTSSKREMKEEL